VTSTQKIPKLRFKEFDGEWEEKRLGEIIKKLSRQSNNLKKIK
jgi:hypothetical protein